MAIIHSVSLASLYDISQRRNNHYYTLLDAMHIRTFENNLHAPMQIRCIHSIAWNGKPKHICQRICIFTRFSNSSFRNGDVVIGSESTVYRHIYWLTFGRKNYVLLVRYTRIMQRVTFLPPIVKKNNRNPETLWIGKGVIISHSSTQLFTCTPPFAYFKLLYFNAFYLFWNNTTEAWPKCMYKFTMNK